MNPKKAKESVPDVAREMNLPLGFVEELCKYFWTEVREALSGLKNIRIHVAGLGDFQIKYWLLDKEIQRYSLRKYRVSQSQEQLDKLNFLKEMHLAEKQRKEFIYQHKHTEHELIIENLEQQNADFTGDIPLPL